MRKKYSELLTMLQKRKIEVRDYTEFLSLSLEGQFKQVSQSLIKRDISLPEFLQYLAQNVQQTNSSEITSFYKSEDLFQIEAAGQYLLEKKHLTLTEINQQLTELEIIDFKSFLKGLLRYRKIQPEEFVQFVYGKYPKNTSSLYRLKSQSTKQICFYLTSAEGEKKYGDYILLEELGRGGMGIVYKAYHPKLNRLVALKVLLARNLASEKTIQRFKREIEVMAQLNHEGIVRIYNSGKEGEELYLAMEYIEGNSLSQHLSRLTLKEKVKITQQILNALQYAHEQGIVHRDLKLENILLTPKNQPKIVDFGLAKMLGEAQKENQELTQSGAVLGTAMYMAPEQAAGKIKEADARTDIYAIGVCLYHLLTKQFPFKGKTLQQLLYRIVYNEPTPPSKYLPFIRKDLEAILLKSLEKSKEQRYSSAKSFAEDLERFLEGLPVEALNKEMKTKIRRFLNKNQRKLLVALMAFLILLGGLLVKLGSGYQERKALFEKKYQAFFQQNLKQQSKKTIGDFYRKLQSWNYLNEALHIIPKHPLAEQKKWEIAEEILKEILKKESRYFGDYLMEEMQQLSSIPQKKRIKRKQQWEQEKKAYWRKEEIRFQYWITKLQSGEFPPSEATDALFEISRMNAPAINLKLLAQLQEGNHFFARETNPQEEKKAKFYRWLIEVLSRRKVKAALPLICEGLSTLGSKYKNFKMPNELSKVHCMIEMSRYLLAIEAYNKAEFLSKKRMETGYGTLFWTRIPDIEKKLFQLLLKKTNIDSKKLQTSEEFYHRGLTKQSGGDFNGAILDFTQAIERNPQYEFAYNNRGNSKCSKGDLIGAIIDFNNALRINPMFAIAYTNRGLAKAEKGDLDGAILDFSETIRLKPLEPLAYGYRGDIKRLKKDLAGAILDYNQAIHLNPQFILAFHERGKIKGEKGDLDGAILDFTEAIHLNPKDATSYSNRGIAKLEKEDFKGAIADFTKAIRLNPQLIDTYYNRGNAKRESGDLEGAILDYTQMIYLQPEEEKAYTNRGLAKANKGDLVGAILDFNEVIRLNPNDAFAYNNRGIVKQDMGDLAGAILDFNESLRLNPQHAYAFMNRGNLKRDQKNFNAAIQDYNEAIRLNPQYAFAYINRGITKRMQKKIDEVIEDLEKGIAIEPDPNIEIMLIDLLQQQTQERFKKKEWQNAKDSLLKLKKYLNPQDPQHAQIDKNIQFFETMLQKKE